MASGQVDWHMARTWYDKCRNLPHHEAGTIAARLFCRRLTRSPTRQARVHGPQRLSSSVT